MAEARVDEARWAGSRGLVQRLPRIAASLLVLTILSTAASARIQDYQIVRLLTYKTDCDVAQLQSVPISGTGRHYKATCRNLTFYPEGIEVICDDPQDEQSCKVVTQPRSFDNLHALQPKD